MGYDLGLFNGTVDEELICPICSCVLEEPVQADDCEHAFCRVCIEEWLGRRENCPVDRLTLTVGQLVQVPRILRNMLGRLLILCTNHSLGCAQKVRLDNLDRHQVECEFNPKKPIACQEGCGLMVPRDIVQDHHCVRDLRRMVESQEKKLNQLFQKLNEQHVALQSQNRDIAMLREALRALGSAVLPSGGGAVGLFEQQDNEALHTWASTLPRARIFHWGRLISTPDTVLQSVIRSALTNAGCSVRVVEELMEKCEERNWPTALRSLELRRSNRGRFNLFTARRVPGKQAVVVLNCENLSLPREFSLPSPGIVLIFANGVECSDTSPAT